jgi:hypothetical protein
VYANHSNDHAQTVCGTCSTAVCPRSRIPPALLLLRRFVVLLLHHVQALCICSTEVLVRGCIALMF